MFSDDVVFVIGVDTHRDTHAYAVVQRATGVIVDQFQFPADGAGYRDALRRVRRAGGGGRVWAVEGTGSYGAGLTDVLQAGLVSGWWPDRLSRPRGPVARKQRGSEGRHSQPAPSGNIPEHSPRPVRRHSTRF